MSWSLRHLGRGSGWGACLGRAVEPQRQGGTDQGLVGPEAGLYGWRIHHEAKLACCQPNAKTQPGLHLNRNQRGGGPGTLQTNAHLGRGCRGAWAWATRPGDGPARPWGAPWPEGAALRRWRRRAPVRRCRQPGTSPRPCSVHEGRLGQGCVLEAAAAAGQRVGVVGACLHAKAALRAMVCSLRVGSGRPRGEEKRGAIFWRENDTAKGRHEVLTSLPLSSLFRAH